MNLKEWAASQGISYATARRQYAAGTLPVPTYRLGRLIMVGAPLATTPAQAGQVVVYARVSSADQKADLDRQVARITAWATERNLATALRKLRRLSRAVSGKVGPDRRVRRAPSNRWQRAQQRVARAHARVANLRRDSLHKLTTSLASRYGTVVVEDLNVAGMLSNRRLARHIADAGFGELRRLLEYKTACNGGRLVVADRWYPSSKTCSGCGAVKAKLPLTERVYVCQACGLVLDRDLNAARNLANLVVAGSGPETLNGRGADRKTRPGGLVAGKRQSGTATAGKTGTVPPQGGTARQVRTKAH